MNVFQQYKKSVILSLLLVILVLMLGFTRLPWIISKPLMVKASIQKAPVIVVLYCGYGKPIKNGLSRYALNRVKKGVDLWKNGVAPYILFSGGRSDRNHSLTGAERMALEAVRLCVPDTRLIKETGSRDTRYNVRNTAAVLNEKGWHRLVLVTDAYHLKRAMTLFTRMGFTVFPAPVAWKDKDTWSHNWAYLCFLCYEIQARAAYLLLDDHQIDRLMDVLRPD